MKLKSIQTVVVLCAVVFSAFAMTRPKLNPHFLQVRFVNTSNDTIKDFVFENKKIGALTMADTTKYYKFDSLVVGDNNRLLANANAFYKYGDIDYYNHARTPAVKMINDGKFTVDVNMYMSCGIGFDMVLSKEN
jgi:hypothetical protein